MASITEGAKARQEAMAMELKFHQDKLKQLTGLSTSNNSSRINKKDNAESTSIHNKGKDNSNRNNNNNITLIFGYASVIWKPGFPFVNKWWGYIKNYNRRFWQGSPDHRGTPRHPGRVATLLPTTVVNGLEQKEVTTATESKTWGVVFEIDPSNAENILAQLDHREKAGFVRVVLPIYCEDGVTRNALVYSATESNESFLGPSHIDTMGWHIYNSVGPSGPNKEYLYNLYDALIVEKKLTDLHIESLYKVCKSFENLIVCATLSDFEQNQDFCAKYYGFGRPIKVINVEWPHVFYHYMNDEDDANVNNEDKNIVLHANALFHIRQKTNAFVFKNLEDEDDDDNKNKDEGNRNTNIVNDDKNDDGNESSSSSSSSDSD